MRDPALLESLERAFHVETRSFVRYVYEVSSPVGNTEWDRKVQARVEEWYLETRAHLATILKMLEKEGFEPASSNWPLSHAQCNFLTWERVVKIIAGRSEPTFRMLEEEAEKLAAGWSDAAAVIRDIIQKERALLAKVVELTDSIDEKPRPSGERKQVSANFW